MLTESKIRFLNTLVDVRVSEADGEDGLSVLEHRAPWGDSPPLHVHRPEDEVFHVLEGELRFRVGGAERLCGPGAVLLAPKGVPHTYRVESRAGARFVTVTAHRDFERFVRSFGRRAERDGLPPPAPPPDGDAVAALAKAAAAFGIELMGPPLA